MVELGMQLSTITSILAFLDRGVNATAAHQGDSNITTLSVHRLMLFTRLNLLVLIMGVSPPRILRLKTFQAVRMFPPVMLRCEVQTISLVFSVGKILLSSQT